MNAPDTIHTEASLFSVALLSAERGPVCSLLRRWQRRPRRFYFVGAQTRLRLCAFVSSTARLGGNGAGDNAFSAYR